MTSSEAGKGEWGSMHSSGPVPIVPPAEGKLAAQTKPLKDICVDEKRPIIDEEEVPQ
jgi:hypothetical protein